MIAEELKQRIILKTGLSSITPRDCSYISQGIYKTLKRNVSVTTLKRAFGFTKSSHSPSKYTITTLNDYAPFPIPTLMPCTIGNERVHSFILQQGISFFELNDEVGLHPKRSLIEALDVLLKNNQENSPVVIAGKCVGIVYIKDLIRFLASDDKMYGTLYHKFNFTLENTIDLLQHIK